MRADSLSVSIVSFDPDLALLERALASLARSISHAQADGKLGDALVCVVDNGPRKRFFARLDALVGSVFATMPGIQAAVLPVNANKGYGAANNLAIHKSTADFHLVLNPDVILDQEAITQALDFMRAHESVVLISPMATDQHGVRQYLCKRHPGILTLLLRGFAPSLLRLRFSHIQQRYEMQNETNQREYFGDFLAGGCFMFMRLAALQQVGGFDPRFFMYFEDYDLSLRLAACGPLAYVPAVKIVHHGGHASRKGWRHRIPFMLSATRFFRRHGWKLV
jgi:hypothetical protein